MNISKQARRDAKNLFRATLVNGVMDENKVRQVVSLVAEKKPRGYMNILTHFQRLVKLELDRRKALVETAVPISPEQQQAITANLERIYGPGLSIRFEQNPALLGGMRARVGSDVYDDSVQARLDELVESFA